jgi:carbon starvation protein
MFEAVFILAAVDTGTRVGRFLLQEIAGNVIPKFKEEKWVPGIIICGVLFSFLWGRLLYTGSIATIWPLFGISNQLLAACGLIVGTTLIIRLNRVRYAWITVVPGIFIAVITFLAGGLLIIDQYLPQGHYFLIVFSISIAGLMLIIFYRAIRRWFRLIGIKETVIDNNGEKVLAVVDE